MNTVPPTRRRQFLLFLLVGLVNTGLGYLVYGLGVYCGLHHAFALTCSTLAGVVFNFFSTGRIVFRNRSLRPFARYLAVQAVVFTVNGILLELACRAGLGPLSAQAVCLPPVVMLGFILMRAYAFKAVKGDVCG